MPLADKLAAKRVETIESTNTVICRTTTITPPLVRRAAYRRRRDRNELKTKVFKLQVEQIAELTRHREQYTRLSFGSYRSLPDFTSICPRVLGASLFVEKFMDGSRM